MQISDMGVEVVRKNIKNLHVGVYPPNGHVRVAAPLLMDDEAVRLALISKLDWIKRQKRRFQDQERQAQREYVNRESHYFQGKRYLLNVIEQNGPSKVMLRNKTFIDLYVQKGADIEAKERILQAWYRRELKALIPELIKKWSKIIDVEVSEWGVKRMKTKWGSCNPEAKRIWLNLELAKKPTVCLEYIVVHEMIHLVERKHGERFTKLMDRFLPQWRSYREELNRTPLAHEAWKY
jgi:predicted metal-dependent hydrolase